MEAQSVVLYQNDPGAAQILAAGLSQHFSIVCLARTCEEVRQALTRTHAAALVLDLEAAGTGEVERLHRELPALYILATHRLADVELWTDALNHGASDICEPRNEEVARCVLRGLLHEAVA